MVIRTLPEIKRIVTAKLAQAQTRFEAASAVFSCIPGGLLHPKGVYSIHKGGRERTAARTAFFIALKQFDDFIFCGVIPDELWNQQEPSVLGPEYQNCCPAA